MDEEVYCLNQVFRPKLNLNVPGTGNCTICTPHEDNILCKNYKPVTFCTFTVTEKE